MYCSNCGKKIETASAYCPECGARLQIKTPPAEHGSEEPVSDVKTHAPYNVLCIIGFAVSCVSLFLHVFGLVGVGGLILSILGLNECRHHNERGRGLAIAGIVISIISILLGVLLVMLGVGLITGIFEALINEVYW